MSDQALQETKKELLPRLQQAAFQGSVDEAKQAWQKDVPRLKVRHPLLFAVGFEFGHLDGLCACAVQILLTSFGPFGSTNSQINSDETFTACKLPPLMTYVDEYKVLTLRLDTGNALEASCLVCLRAGDFVGFERQVYQLRTVYSEYEYVQQNESID